MSGNGPEDPGLNGGDQQDFHDEPDAEVLIRQVIESLDGAKSVPLSTSVFVGNKDALVEALETALGRMPTELRQARWMLRERDEHLLRVRREAEEILESARVRAERLVQRTEIVREAQRVAQRTVDEAREAAHRLRLEAEDYCDQKLASFELALARIQRTVAAGRAKLRGPLEQAIADAEAAARATGGSDGSNGARAAGSPPGPFDQDAV